MTSQNCTEKKKGRKEREIDCKKTTKVGVLKWRQLRTCSCTAANIAAVLPWLRFGCRTGRLAGERSHAYLQRSRGKWGGYKWLARSRAGCCRLHCKSGRNEYRVQALFQRAVGGQMLPCQQVRCYAVVKQRARTSTDWSGLFLILVTITDMHAHILIMRYWLSKFVRARASALYTSHVLSSTTHRILVSSSSLRN